MERDHVSPETATDWNAYSISKSLRCPRYYDEDGNGWNRAPSHSFWTCSPCSIWSVMVPVVFVLDMAAYSCDLTMNGNHEWSSRARAAGQSEDESGPPLRGQTMHAQ